MTAQTHKLAVHGPMPSPITSDEGPRLAAPEARGRLVISDTAVEKIAGQIVADAPGIGGARTGILGLAARETFDTRPSVSVALSGRTASVTAHIGLTYPTQIRSATDELRTLLRKTLTRLTGVEIRQVDIHVRWLRPDSDGSNERRLL